MTGFVFLREGGRQSSFNMVQTVAHVVGCRYSSVDLSAPSIVPPGFESQAHYLCFHQFIELSNVEKTKLNRKEAGIGTLFNNNKKLWHML